MRLIREINKGNSKILSALLIISLFGLFISIAYNTFNSSYESKFVEVKAMVVDTDVRSEHSQKQGTSYHFYATFEYEYNNTKYTGTAKMNSAFSAIPGIEKTIKIHSDYPYRIQDETYRNYSMIFIVLFGISTVISVSAFITKKIHLHRTS